jgi:hypothetical protein
VRAAVATDARRATGLVQRLWAARGR